MHPAGPGLFEEIAGLREQVAAVKAELAQARVILANISGALVDSGVPVPSQEGYAKAIRTLTREMDAANERVRDYQRALSTRDEAIAALEAGIGRDAEVARLMRERDEERDEARASLAMVRKQADDALALHAEAQGTAHRYEVLIETLRAERDRRLTASEKARAAAEAERDRLCIELDAAREAITKAEAERDRLRQALEAITRVCDGSCAGCAQGMARIAKNALAAPATGEAARPDGVEHG